MKILNIFKKKNNIKNIYLIFKNEESKKTFISLSVEEKEEFNNDLINVLQKEKEKMENAKVYEAENKANQRLGNRHFIAEFVLNLKERNIVYFIFFKFKEVEIDEYLDYMNDNKNLKNKGYEKLI